MMELNYPLNVSQPRIEYEQYELIDRALNQFVSQSLVLRYMNSFNSLLAQLYSNKALVQIWTSPLIAIKNVL